MKHFLLSCVFLLMVYIVDSYGDADNKVRSPTASSQLDQHDDLRTNGSEVLVQQDQDVRRKRDVDIIQAFAEIHAKVKNLEQRIDSLTLENQSWKAQLQILTASKMADEEEAARFRSRVEDEIQNLKDRLQNCTNWKPAEVAVQVEPSPPNATEGTNQSQGVNTTMDPETEKIGPDQKWLDDMLETPNAKLYSGENFTGENEWYRSESLNKGQCQGIRSLRHRVKSVETFGKCVRLFQYDDCTGWSLAVYPGSANSHSILNSKLLKVKSVGPCIEEEFEGSTFQDSRKETVWKNTDGKTYVPDLVEFYSHEKYRKGTRLPNSNNPIERYNLGPKNRVEFLFAQFSPRRLYMSQPTGNMINSSFFTSLDKEDGDVVGYGIPPSLGGPWNENYNIFPQTLAGRQEWTRIASQTRQSVETDRRYRAFIALNFMYADNTTTRPLAFYYFMYCYNGTNNISYGRVVN